MNLEIKGVRKCRDDSYGYFKVLGTNRARIVISFAKNNSMHQYAETLLHELLHFYTALLQAEGFKVNQHKEHKWIEACEWTIIDEMKRHMKRRK